MNGIMTVQRVAQEIEVGDVGQIVFLAKPRSAMHSKGLHQN